jgi:opacity protein-like surface antigen
MRHRTRVVLLAVVCSAAAAAPAVAQSGPAAPAAAAKEPRFSVLVNGGYQPSTTSFDDEFSTTLYQEQQTTSVSYAVVAGPLFEGGAAVRVWKGLGAGAVFSTFSVDGTASVTSSVPHPLLLQHNREVSGEAANLRREETALHIQAQYRLPPFGPLQIVLSGGPSLIAVKQAVVINVRYTETYPYDTADFAGVDSRRVSATASGYNAGVDFQWMFNENVGAGALVRITRATVELPVENRTIQVDAGGTQVGVGLRLVF